MVAATTETGGRRSRASTPHRTTSNRKIGSTAPASLEVRPLRRAPMTRGSWRGPAWVVPVGDRAGVAVVVPGAGAQSRTLPDDGAASVRRTRRTGFRRPRRRSRCRRASRRATPTARRPHGWHDGRHGPGLLVNCLGGDLGVRGERSESVCLGHGQVAGRKLPVPGTRCLASAGQVGDQPRVVARVRLRQTLRRDRRVHHHCPRVCVCLAAQGGVGDRPGAALHIGLEQAHCGRHGRVCGRDKCATGRGREAVSASARHVVSSDAVSSW